MAVALPSEWQRIERSKRAARATKAASPSGINGSTIDRKTTKET